MSGVGVSLKNTGKKFGSEWIFRNLSYDIAAGEKLVILGGNGSGKSTLLQVISGYVSQTEGDIVYNGSVIIRPDQAAAPAINKDQVHKHISFASPYLQLVEDFTLEEMVAHSAIFKPFLNGMKTAEVIQVTELAHAKNKFIRQFSSGMKQRLKLALAVLADTGLLLLDEPVSNLDKKAIDWYHQMIGEYAQNRTVVVCSNNIDQEFSFCNKHINVEDYKFKKVV